MQNYRLSTANKVIDVTRNGYYTNRQVEKTAEYFTSNAPDLREQIMQDVAAGKMDIPGGTNSLEAIRWLRRVSLHLSRILHHFSRHTPST